MRLLVKTENDKRFIPLAHNAAALMSSIGPNDVAVVFAVPDVVDNHHGSDGVEWRVWQPWIKILIETDPTYPELIRINYNRAHTSATGGRPKYTPIGEAVYRLEDIKSAIDSLGKLIHHINTTADFFQIKDTVELASAAAVMFLRELVGIPVHGDPLMQTTVSWVGDRVGGTSVHLHTPAGIVDVRLYTPDIGFDIFTEHEEKVKMTVSPFAVEHRKVGKHKGRTTTGQITKFEIPTIIYLNMLIAIQKGQDTWGSSRDSVLYHAFRKCLRASRDDFQLMVQFPVHQLPAKERSFRICVEGGTIALIVKIANLNERTVMKYYPKKDVEIPC